MPSVAVGRAAIVWWGRRSRDWEEWPGERLGSQVGAGVLTCTHQTPRLTRTVPDPSPGGRGSSYSPAAGSWPEPKRNVQVQTGTRTGRVGLTIPGSGPGQEPALATRVRREFPHWSTDRPPGEAGGGLADRNLGGARASPAAGSHWRQPAPRLWGTRATGRNSLIGSQLDEVAAPRGAAAAVLAASHPAPLHVLVRSL